MNRSSNPTISSVTSSAPLGPLEIDATGRIPSDFEIPIPPPTTSYKQLETIPRGTVQAARDKLEGITIRSEQDKTIQHLVSACDHTLRGVRRRSSVGNIIENLEREHTEITRLSSRTPSTSLKIKRDHRSASRNISVRVSAQYQPSTILQEDHTIESIITSEPIDEHVDDSSAGPATPVLIRTVSLASLQGSPGIKVVKNRKSYHIVIPTGQAVPVRITLDSELAAASKNDSTSAKHPTTHVAPAAQSSIDSSTTVMPEPDQDFVTRTSTMPGTYNLTQPPTPTGERVQPTAEAIESPPMQVRTPAQVALSKFDVRLPASRPVVLADAQLEQGSQVNDAALHEATTTQAEHVPDSAIDSHDQAQEIIESAPQPPVPAAQIQEMSSESGSVITTLIAQDVLEDLPSSSPPVPNPTPVDTTTAPPSRLPDLTSVGGDDIPVEVPNAEEVLENLAVPAMLCAAPVDAHQDVPNPSTNVVGENPRPVLSLSVSNISVAKEPILKRSFKARMIEHARKAVLRRPFLDLLLGREAGAAAHQQLQQKERVLEIIRDSRVAGMDGMISPTGTSSVPNPNQNMPRDNPALDPNSPIMRAAQPHETWQAKEGSVGNDTVTDLELEIREDIRALRQRKATDAEQADRDLLQAFRDARRSRGEMAKRTQQEAEREREDVAAPNQEVGQAVLAKNDLRSAIATTNSLLVEIPHCPDCGKNFPSPPLEEFLMLTLKLEQSEVASQLSHVLHIPSGDMIAAQGQLRDKYECACPNRQDFRGRRSSRWSLRRPAMACMTFFSGGESGGKD